MIQYAKNSDITNVTSGIIAHGVNCLGVMGAGVALAIRQRWPVVYEAYQKNSVLGDELLGSCHAVRVDADLWIANCYTQKTTGPRGTGKYADVDALRRSLGFAFGLARSYNMKLHAPKIASDLGGLDWETEVLPIFEDLNSEYDDVDVVIHTL